MYIFLVAIAAGLIAGWARGGSLLRIGTARVAWLWLAPVAFGAQLLLAYAVGLEVPWWVMPLHLGSIALLLQLILVNWRMTGLAVVGVGLLMNAAVITANGGLMPQAPETLHVRHPGDRIEIGQHPPLTKDVVLPREQMRLGWFADILATPPGWPVRTVMSPGDLAIAVGLALTVQQLMVRSCDDRDELRSGAASGWRRADQPALP
jgi:hypothetical protein